jgi:hypothetical protein
MRRSIVLSLPPQSVFPEKGLEILMFAFSPQTQTAAGGNPIKLDHFSVQIKIVFNNGTVNFKIVSKFNL